MPAADFVEAVLRGQAFPPKPIAMPVRDLAALNSSADRGAGAFPAPWLDERRASAADAGPAGADRAGAVAAARHVAQSQAAARRWPRICSTHVPLPDGAAIAERWPVIRALAAAGARPYIVAGVPPFEPFPPHRNARRGVAAAYPPDVERGSVRAMTDPAAGTGLRRIVEDREIMEPCPPPTKCRSCCSSGSSIWNSSITTSVFCRTTRHWTWPIRGRSATRSWSAGPVSSPICFPPRTTVRVRRQCISAGAVRCRLAPGACEWRDGPGRGQHLRCRIVGRAARAGDRRPAAAHRNPRLLQCRPAAGMPPRRFSFHGQLYAVPRRRRAGRSALPEPGSAGRRVHDLDRRTTYDAIAAEQIWVCLDAIGAPRPA